MRFKSIDHLRYVPTVCRPTLSLLFFPPKSYTPSGFYLIEPNGLGGNKITLVKPVAVDIRTAKAWYMSTSDRMRIIMAELFDSPASEVRKMLATGKVDWSSQVAEDLVTKVVNDPTNQEDEHQL